MSTQLSPPFAETGISHMLAISAVGGSLQEVTLVHYTLDLVLHSTRDRIYVQLVSGSHRHDIVPRMPAHMEDLLLVVYRGTPVGNAGCFISGGTLFPFPLATCPLACISGHLHEAYMIRVSNMES